MLRGQHFVSGLLPIYFVSQNILLLVHVVLPPWHVSSPRLDLLHSDFSGNKINLNNYIQPINYNFNTKAYQVVINR